MAADQVFRRLQRRITLAERSYKDAFAELERLQRARTPLADPLNAPQPQPDTGDSSELGSFLHVSGDSPRPPCREQLDPFHITGNQDRHSTFLARNPNRLRAEM
jgi:hypothetical protein